MRYSVDPWPRIQFYVRCGLVPIMPTPEQLMEAGKINLSGFGVAERMKHFIRHPEEVLFPTKRRKQELLRTPLSEMSQETKVGCENKGTCKAPDPPLPRVEQVLKKAYQFPALRFVTACYFNPYFWPANSIAATGLTIPLKYLIAHVCHEPHYTALWDVQIIHADKGGLDQLEHEIELSATGRGLKPLLYRAMTQSVTYYDYLRDLVPRVRRFEYPPPPPGWGLRTSNLVSFLNYATTL